MADSPYESILNDGMSFDALMDKLINIFSFVYPIGSIYLSVNNTNPSVLFGGTWVAWGAGRVPVGVDTTQTEFSTVGKTGGEKTHILTIDEMPSHDHATQGYNNCLYGTGAQVSSRLIVPGDPIDTQSTIKAKGGGLAHNNLQPYITCYMWKRTA